MTLQIPDRVHMANSRRRGTLGLLVGISSGAMIWAARQLRRRWPGTIATVLPDRAERYFSTALL